MLCVPFVVVTLASLFVIVPLIDCTVALRCYIVTLPPLLFPLNFTVPHTFVHLRYCCCCYCSGIVVPLIPLPLLFVDTGIVNYITFYCLLMLLITVIDVVGICSVVICCSDTFDSVVIVIVVTTFDLVVNCCWWYIPGWTLPLRLALLLPVTVRCCWCLVALRLPRCYIVPFCFRCVVILTFIRRIYGATRFVDCCYTFVVVAPAPFTLLPLWFYLLLRYVTFVDYVVVVLLRCPDFVVCYDYHCSCYCYVTVVYWF